MKKLVLSATLLLSHALSYGQDLERFNFLIGKWTARRASGIITESWVKNGREFAGKSFKVSPAGDSVLLETMVLKKEKGEILFTPATAGQNDDKPVRFKLISSKDNTYIFENKLHDFPSRVVYQLKSPGELFAWIEGRINGEFTKIEYPYLRDKN